MLPLPSFSNEHPYASPSLGRHDECWSPLLFLKGYKLSLRRNLGHAAAKSVILALDAPVGHRTIYRWEKLLAANIVVEAHSFYQTHRRHLDLVVPDVPLCLARVHSWEIHAVRGDATNSAAIHSYKAHVTEVLGIIRLLLYCRNHV